MWGSESSLKCLNPCHAYVHGKLALITTENTKKMCTCLLLDRFYSHGLEEFQLSLGNEGLEE